MSFVSFDEFADRFGAKTEISNMVKKPSCIWCLMSCLEESYQSIKSNFNSVNYFLGNSSAASTAKSFLIFHCPSRKENRALEKRASFQKL